MGFCSRLGESPNSWKHFEPAPTQVLNSVILVLLRQETATWGGRHLLILQRLFIKWWGGGFFVCVSVCARMSNHEQE